MDTIFSYHHDAPRYEPNREGYETGCCVTSRTRPHRKKWHKGACMREDGTCRGNDYHCEVTTMPECPQHWYAVHEA